MARGSYLDQIAWRAVQDTPALLPPRRRVRATPVAAPDHPLTVPQVPSVPSPTTPAADPIPPRMAATIGAPASASADQHLGPEPSSPDVVESSPSPPRAVGVPDALPVEPAPDPVVDVKPIHEIPPPQREPVAAAAKPTEPFAPPPPRPRRPPEPRRNIAVAPDPLAVALAAAVRWTSSDDERPVPR